MNKKINEYGWVELISLSHAYIRNNLDMEPGDGENMETEVHRHDDSVDICRMTICFICSLLTALQNRYWIYLYLWVSVVGENVSQP